MRVFGDKRALTQYCALLGGSLFCSMIGRFAQPIYPLALCSFTLAVALAWLAVIREANGVAIYLPHFWKRAVHWIYAQTLEIFALLFVGILFFGSLFRKSHPTKGRSRPILLVHGYLNGDYVWNFIKKHLAKNGFGPIYTINLGHPFQSIHSYALKVQQKAHQIAQETGAQDLILIGHSMGGLVSYFYAAKLAQAYSVAKVITIGSPLQGTRMAKIGIGRCARDMQINSTLIRELNPAIKWCTDVKFFNIASHTDELIIPETSAIFKPAPAHYCFFDDIGHASMLFSKRVLNQLCQWLKD